MGADNLLDVDTGRNYCGNCYGRNNNYTDYGVAQPLLSAYRNLEKGKNQEAQVINYQRKSCREILKGSLVH